MTKDEFRERITRCIKKAGIEYSWWYTEDEDEDFELYVDDKECLYIKGLKMPFTLDMVKKIKYRVYDEEYFDEGNEFYVYIIFDNGELRLGMDNYNDDIKLFIDENGKKQYYCNEKVYTYLRGFNQDENYK